MPFSKSERLCAMVAAMRGPPDGRSPAGGGRDRASIIITGKVSNPLISTPSAGPQPSLPDDVVPEVVLASLRLTALRIETKSDGTYTADPQGRLAVLVPVRDRWGEIADIVAFTQEAPEQWWCRYGDETPILGAWALAHAAWERQPLVLWETPLQWLLQRRSGSVVLDWGVDLRPVFEDIPVIDCQSPALRERLRQNFLEFGPELSVRTDAAYQNRGVRVA